MARKSNATAAKVYYPGHLLMEHRSALLVDIELTEATGYAERDAALEMLDRLPPTRRRRTLAGDKGYDTTAFVTDVRGLGITPHLAPNTTRRRSAIDGRTTRHAGHGISQRIRKTHRGTIRLDEDHRRWTEASLHPPTTEPGVVRHDRSDLQHGPHRRPRRHPRLS